MPTAEFESCGNCGASFRGEPIPEKYFEHDLTSEEHKDSVEASRRMFGDERCFCLPYGDLPPEARFWDSRIGIEDPMVYDGILVWLCPFCGDMQPRFSAEGDLALHRKGRLFISERMTSE